MAPLHVSEIYAQELLPKRHGYPLWFPEPEVGTPPREIKIGDVGFLFQGKFIPLFNITEAETSDVNSKFGVPQGFVPLEVQWDLLSRREPNALQNRVISSRSVRHTEVQADVQSASTVAGGAISYRYRFEEQSGALLLLKDNAVLHCLLPNKIFPAYMKEHYHSWEHWAEAKGFAVGARNPLVLVRGTIKTSEWTVAAFRSRNEMQAASLHGSLMALAEGGFKLTSELENNGSVEHRSGPQSHRFPSESPSQTHQVEHTSELPVHLENASIGMNQCIFLQTYRIRFRFLRNIPPGIAIKAAAEDDNPPNSGPSTDSDGVVSSTSVEQDGRDEHIIEYNFELLSAERNADPMDIVLEYILDNSSVYAAITSEEDINELLQGMEWPEDIRGWLQEHQPRIEVHNSCGFLSPLSHSIANQHLPSMKQAPTELEVDARRPSTSSQSISTFDEGRQASVSAWSASPAKNLTASTGREMYHIPNLDPTLPSVTGLLIIPQSVWTPAAGPREWERGQTIRFSQNGRPGFDLTAALRRNLNGMPDGQSVPFITLTGQRAAIRINWPGYEPWYKHFNVMINSEHINKARLAYEVAKVVEKFYTEMSQTRGNVDGWGTQQIPFEQLILLELRNVGIGSWQPVLARIMT